VKHVLVIGGGVAGMEASAKLSEMGFKVSIVEQSEKTGGKLNQWNALFPDHRSASELLHKIETKLSPSVQKYISTEVLSVQRNKQQFTVVLSNGSDLKADAILVSTGFDVFDAQKKEEYGYRIYDNVITSADLEKILLNHKELKTSTGKTPKRIGIIHCVGSRDEKAGHTYCSQVCCITAVKQAIDIRKQLPESEVFCFYMDLRMFGRKFEDIYRQAQVDYGVQFIRGRLSEAFENTDGSVVLKTEDTLLGKPLKMNVDIVVLMVGMVPSATTKKLNDLLGLKTETDGFYSVADVQYESTISSVPGIFVTGTCTGPKTMENTLNDARSAALQISEYLTHESKKEK
jgi:heterodisulfide reductase subunit A2